jgi:hypothetical protein
MHYKSCWIRTGSASNRVVDKIFIRDIIFNASTFFARVWALEIVPDDWNLGVSQPRGWHQIDIWPLCICDSWLSKKLYLVLLQCPVSSIHPAILVDIWPVLIIRTLIFGIPFLIVIPFLLISSHHITVPNVWGTTMNWQFFVTTHLQLL